MARLLILNHVVKYNQNLDVTFSALADPTRRAILASLCAGQASVTELARPHRMSLPAVMKHLRVLEQAGLISQEKAGRVRRCRLAAQPLQHALAWLSQYRAFWEKQFDALDRYLTQQQTVEVTGWPRHTPRHKQRSK
jgi:DNA-binding transcriptional ArsR family regulator